MMNALLLILTTLFLLKLLWNVITPYIVERRFQAWQKEGGKKPSAISMTSIVEVILWFLLIAFSFSDGNWCSAHTIIILIFGACAIVISYVLAAFIGFIARKKAAATAHRLD
ncbi:MAG: hypothetical protein PHU06_10855 [Gallionella sp.]|nr:hypothetical protein [Gallionella sp.]MDD4959154.1 hypothetical protein [Gallionella sp.]